MRKSTWAAAAAALSIAVGGLAWLMTEDGVATIREDALTGRWQKVTGDACAARYPAVIDVKPGGIYAAPGAPEAGAYWHGGDWFISEDGIFTVQVANDRNVGYRVVEITETRVQLEDEDGCRFAYERAG